MTDASDLPGWTHVYSGKVRDLYRPAESAATTAAASAAEGRMLVVASDRVSAFDHVLSPGIPGKGELLTTLSLWWFDQLSGADGGPRIPNHLAATHALTLGPTGRRTPPTTSSTSSRRPSRAGRWWPAPSTCCR